MRKPNILLSSGTFPWMDLKTISYLGKKTGFDGIEFVPTKYLLKNPFDYQNTFIKSLHQNWRLDMGNDKSYRISFWTSIFFNLIRFYFFPNTHKSNDILSKLSKKHNIPVVIHNLKKSWTNDNANNEFRGGILFEIINTSVSPKYLKSWLKSAKHNIVIDSRDDQSLVWAKKYDINTWKKFWTWVGINKIKNYQLSLIGNSGIDKILNHKKSLAEEELLWLHKSKWKNNVTVEINPFTLILKTKGKYVNGLKTINKFVKQTLVKGKRWSS